MDRNKVLILREADKESDMFYNGWLEAGFNVDKIFKPVNIVFRAIRRKWLMNNWPCSGFWFGKWLNELDKYELVIIHMSRLTRYLPKLIVDLYPDIKVIGWYWNTINKESEPIDFKNSHISYWSFDKKDCEKYHLKHNIQYYACPKETSHLTNTQDVYFVGREKGRKDKINELKAVFDKNGISYKLNVIYDDKDYIAYRDVQNEIRQSKAILEINKKDQEGFSLRVLESLFFGVKLITDNKAIINSPIYNKENIFVLGVDGFAELKEFINSPYNHETNRYQKDYSLDTWFNNFVEDNGK